MSFLDYGLLEVFLLDYGLFSAKISAYSVLLSSYTFAILLIIYYLGYVVLIRFKSLDGALKCLQQLRGVRTESAAFLLTITQTKRLRHLPFLLGAVGSRIKWMMGVMPHFFMQL